MPTISVDIPRRFYRYVESEVEEGRYKSKAEAIRAMIRKEMEWKHSVDEKLSQSTERRYRKQESVETLRETLESLSKTVFEQQLRVDFEEFSEPVKTDVAKEIEELGENNLSNPWKHSDVKYLPGQGGVSTTSPQPSQATWSRSSGSGSV
ncbi:MULTISPECIES: hypothetical protein [unclassified Haloferax]|uniref:ribbon-helix-helix domain-containing protein n=1 Tax=unclassified Haloferax TaxID=2625095 RepID=UPI00287571B5|nr:MULTISPECIES: hypothetical protein [unclassified Haloferax]MDS0243608.1 hypothetical protein [Haloferax sp. S2CR25]MDS0446729.1 hypothetical protein [Haloferax sp. S2CR25-2]